MVDPMGILLAPVSRLPFKELLNRKMMKDNRVSVNELKVSILERWHSLIDLSVKRELTVWSLFFFVHVLS